MTERASLRLGMVTAAVTCVAGAAIGTAVGTAVAVVVAIAAGLAVLAFARVSAIHSWLTRQLRHRSDEAEVAGTRLRLGTVGGTVFVAGLARPEIFCDDALLDELDDAEIGAVTLHERAHQLARDPLRAAMEATVAPLLSRAARGRAWLERRVAIREIAADRYAMAHGTDRRAIASALLKVPPAGPAHVAPFASATELRLRALLGDEIGRPQQRTSLAVTMGAVFGAAACLAMLHPALAVADVLHVCCPV